MEQNPARPARKVAIADHIWQAFEEMAQSMGSDRDGLINQAMFMFARLNGFMDASGSGAPAAAPRSAASAGNGAVALPGRASKSSAPPVLAPAPSPPPVASSRQQSSKLDDDPVRREVAERVLETAAELERLIKGKNSPDEDDSQDDEEMQDEAALDDEQPEGVSDFSADEDGGGEEGGQLYLMAEGGELDRIVKERFLIGRGKHCDFVINSGKVSREHAAIVKDTDGFFIEDLGSSNGTWFNKQRIKRRKIEDGDEYFICSERIKLVVR